MIYPMFAMILLTFCYVFYTAYCRVSMSMRGEVNPRYFKTMSGYEVPEKIQVTTRHFANLLETPPLFYIAGALIIALGIDSGIAETICWVYLTARLAHMFVHNSYNHPVHRMICFMLGLFCILALWIIVLLHVG